MGWARPKRKALAPASRASRHSGEGQRSTHHNGALQTRVAAFAKQSRSGLLALLGNTVERLAEPLEGVTVGGLGAARRGTLDHKLATLTHGIHHARLLGGIPDPGAVVLGVHR